MHEIRGRGSGKVHMLSQDLAREYQRSMIAAAEGRRAGARARQRRRAMRRAARAERRLVNQWDQALKLQARVKELELTR